jgi:hypothetical protein
MLQRKFGSRIPVIGRNIFGLDLGKGYSYDINMSDLKTSQIVKFVSFFYTCKPFTTKSILREL